VKVLSLNKLKKSLYTRTGSGAETLFRIKKPGSGALQSVKTPGLMRMIGLTTSCLDAVRASMVSATIATGGVPLMIHLGRKITQRPSTANHLSLMIGIGLSAPITAHIPTTQQSITTTVIAAGAVIWMMVPTVARTAGTVSKERKISTIRKT